MSTAPITLARRQKCLETGKLDTPEHWDKTRTVTHVQLKIENYEIKLTRYELKLSLRLIGDDGQNNPNRTNKVGLGLPQIPSFRAMKLLFTSFRKRSVRGEPGLALGSCAAADKIWKCV
jgi:hypothetical protein